MRVLLVAYDFPPTQSPRALRWRYLTRELALLGHEVHVLVPDLGDPGVELPRSPGRVVVHRTFPGPLGWLIGRSRRKRGAQPASAPVQPAAPGGARLNWRGRAMDTCKRSVGLVLFPDVRAEWNPWARRALRRLLPELKPDVVVTSHEPASTLPLGLYAQRRGFPWVADLGDPVCAAYTPARWRRRALALEARVSALADRVLVTNEPTRALLVERHGQDPRRCAVLPNGYDDRRIPAGSMDGRGFDHQRLELVYAGRLYGYRDPTPLLQAVAATNGVRLTLVVPDPPEGDAGAALMEGAGDRLRPLGPLPHDQVQAMLERADVLVNFGDHGQPVRIAAKVYEYLGIARPILHVHSGEDDAAAALLRGLGRGWLCAADAGELAALLADLVQRKRDGRLHQGLPSLEPVEDFAHSNLGRRLAAVLAEAAGVSLPDTEASAAEPAGHRCGDNDEAADTGSDPAHLPAHHTGSTPETAPRENPPGALQRELAARRAQVMQLRAEVRERNSEIAILNQRLEWMDAQIRELHGSTSWRVTAPLRSVASAARQLAGMVRHGRGKKPPAAATAAVPASILEGEDTFVLYRIIGNDLPPRHKRGQAIANLRFILEHEPVLAGCEKRFVLNRIRDPGQEREIMDLLDRHGAGYLRIPFEAEAYARTGFDTDVLPAADFLAGDQMEALDQPRRDRLLAAVYRHKNNYAMNNNGARNAALEDGRGRAKWILPWDGNCYLTAEAWQQIRADIASAPQNRYFIVPMARMLDNAPLIRGGDIPRPTEEPQLIFRRDAGERFNPAFCYGRRPKVELFWRLGVEGPWDQYSDDPWDQPRRPLSPEAGLVGRAGWVARLFSGEGTLEAHSDHSTLHRGVARSGAVMAALQHLDLRIAGADPEQPLTIDPATLAKEAASRDHPPLGRLIDALLLAADEARRRWEAPATGTLEDALVDPVVLALAHACTGDGRHAAAGAGVIERVFAEPGGPAGPDPAHARAAAHGSGGAAMRGLHGLLDAARMLERADALREPARSGLRAWLEARLQWLLESPQGLQARGAGDHIGTWHDLEVATIAAFLDDHGTVYSALIRAQARIGGQFAADGRQPAGLVGADTASACCLNLQGWVHLADLAGHWGVDLWGYRPRRGGGLPDGARWLLSHMDKPWPYAQAEDFDVDRFHPIRFAVPGCEDDSPYGFKPVFPSRSGIRPFWNLAGPGGRR